MPQTMQRCRLFSELAIFEDVVHRGRVSNDASNTILFTMGFHLTGLEGRSKESSRLHDGSLRSGNNANPDCRFSEDDVSSEAN